MGIPAQHEVRYRVRFDEADATGHLRPSGLLRYAQDLAWQHSEAAGFDRAWYDERGAHWLVRMVSLEMSGLVRYGDHVDARTEVAGWRRVWARRHTTFTDTAGLPIATADTDWVLLTTEGRPARIPDEISRHFAPGLTFKPDRVELPPPRGERTRVERVVRRSDVDPLGHMNNATYLDVLTEALPAGGDEAGRPTAFRLEYLRPATAGTRVVVEKWPLDDRTLAARMLDEGGEELCRALIS